MADFKLDRELEAKEFNESFKKGRSPRDVYSAWPIWAKNLAKIMAGIIIIIILILIGRSIHHHTELNTKKAGSNTNSASKMTSTNPSQEKSGRASSNSSSKNGSSASATPTAGANGKSGAIPNTGPGDVAALFAVTAGAGTGAHYIISRRRA